MHLNKLHFYRSGSKSLRIFFSGVLDKKLEELTRIVDAAKRNIERYQQLVQISNSNLTKTWMEHVATINASSARALDLVRPLDFLPQQFTGFRSVMSKRNDLSRDLARSAQHHSTSIASRLKAEVNGALQEHLYHAQQQIAATQLHELSADVYARFKAPQLPRPNLTEMQAPVSLYNVSLELREAEAEALKEAASQLRRSLNTLNEQLTKRSPIAATEHCVQTASESLRTDLSQFFQNVELYRSGVFSHTTKDSIATLGIGAELDALETEFTDDDKEAFTQDASNDLFPGAKNLIASGDASSSELTRKTMEVIDAARSIRNERADENKVDVQNTLELECNALRVELQSGLQSETDRLCSNLSLTAANLIVEAKSQSDSAVSLLRSARQKRYVSWFIATAIAFACASWVYHHASKPAPTTIVAEAALNLGCGLLIEAIVLGIVKARENAPKLLAETKNKIHLRLQDDIKRVIHDQLGALSITCINEQTLAAKIVRIYGIALDSPAQAWQVRASATLDTLRNLFAQYTTLRAAYAELVERTRSDSLQYFVDSVRNLSVLNQVAGRIRGQAIEPSFELLEATRRELLSIRTDVEAIAFD